jgi:hypothetical protein
MNELAYQPQRTAISELIAGYVADKKRNIEKCERLIKILRGNGKLDAIYPQYMVLSVAENALTDSALMPEYWIARVCFPNGSKSIFYLHQNIEQELVTKKPVHCKASEQMPYGLATIANESKVYLVEGYKCADIAHQYGIPAITSGGATSYQAHWDLLRAKKIELIGWPDADDAGQNYIAQISARYRFAQVVDVSGFAPKDDIANWLANIQKELGREPSPSDLIDKLIIKSFEPLDPDNLDEGEWLDIDLLHDIESVGIGASQIPDYHAGLPSLISDIISSIRTIVQCDELLALSSTLGAIAGMSSHIAHYVRNEYKSGVISLFMVSLAVSGERKTAVEALLLKQYHICNIDRDKLYRKEMVAYEAKGQRHNKRAQTLLKEYSDGMGTEDAYIAHCQNAPRKPINSQIRVSANASTQFLVHHLANTYPQVFVASSEGGIFYGNYANSAEQASSTQTTWNTLWEGNSEGADLKTENKSASKTNCAISLSLAVQPAQYARWMFSDTGGEQAAGNGANARVLMSYPPSTIGSRRENRNAKGNDGALLPSLAMFYRITRKIMATPAKLGDDGLEPLICLDIRDNHQARELFADYADWVEIGSRKPSGPFSEYQDIASKSAEMALRIACNLAIFERVHQLLLERDQYTSVSQFAPIKEQIAQEIYEDIALTEEELASITLNVEIVSCAINLAKYFLTESIRLIEGLGQEIAGEDAKALLNALMTISDEKGLNGQVPKRMLMRLGKKRWMRSASGMHRIENLIKGELDGYLRIIRQKSKGNNKDSVVFAINPHCFSHKEKFGFES